MAGGVREGWWATWWPFEDGMALVGELAAGSWGGEVSAGGDGGRRASGAGRYRQPAGAPSQRLNRAPFTHLKQVETALRRVAQARKGSARCGTPQIRRMRKLCAALFSFADLTRERVCFAAAAAPLLSSAPSLVLSWMHLQSRERSADNDQREQPSDAALPCVRPPQHTGPAVRGPVQSPIGTLREVRKRESLLQALVCCRECKS